MTLTATSNMESPSSVFSSNSEASASELLGNTEDMNTTLR